MAASSSTAVLKNRWDRIVIGVGPAAGAGQVAAHGPYQPPMPADEIGERLAIAVEEPAQQLAVAHRRLDVGEGAKNGLEGTRGHGCLAVGS